VDIIPPTTIINYPSNNELICGKIAIIGSAFDNSPIKDFKRYQLDYAEYDSTNLDQSVEWKKIHSDNNPLENNNVLAVWDTETVYGYFKLRLSAEDHLGHSSEYVVLVNIVETLDEASNRFGASIESSNRRIQLYIPQAQLKKIHTSMCYRLIQLLLYFHQMIP